VCLNFGSYMHVFKVVFNFVQFNHSSKVNASFYLLSKQMDRRWVYGK
jgi:hypothetical protein